MKVFSTLFIIVALLACVEAQQLRGTFSLTKGKTTSFYQVYQTDGTKTTFDQSQTLATQKGGYLPVITSSEENKFLTHIGKVNKASATSAVDYFFLGSIQTTPQVWAWTKTSQTFTRGTACQSGFYCNWSTGEPNNGKADDVAVVILNNANTLGKWIDITRTTAVSSVIVKFDACPKGLDCSKDITWGWSFDS